MDLSTEGTSMNSPEQAPEVFDPSSKEAVILIAGKMKDAINQARHLGVSANILYVMLSFHAQEMLDTIKEDAKDRIEEALGNQESPQ